MLQINDTDILKWVFNTTPLLAACFSTYYIITITRITIGILQLYAALLVFEREMANQCVSTGCSGPRKAGTQRNMRREERVTVEGPGKKINNVSSPLDGMQMELDLPKTRID